MLNIEFYMLKNFTGKSNIYNVFWIAENVIFSPM